MNAETEMIGGDAARNIIRSMFSRLASQTRSEITQIDDFEKITTEYCDVAAFYRPAQTGIRLEHSDPWKILIEFMIGDNSKGGRLIRTGGETYLAHSGHVHWKHQKPKSERTVLVGTREFYLVSRIDEEDILGRLIAFHLSRFDGAANPSRFHEGGSGDHDGAHGSGERASCLWSARHSPIMGPLKSWLDQEGWSEVDHPIEMEPDLVRRRGSELAVFEVKPEARTHDLICGLGQLMVYGHANQADRRVLVCPRLEERLTQVSETGVRNGIVFLYFREENGDYTFSWSEARQS